jgi:hypothetical protein
MCCGGGDGGECRPLGWLLGLPFALLAVLVSIVGAIIWIIGYAPSLPTWSTSTALYACSGSMYVNSHLRPWRWCRLPISCICPCCLCVTLVLEVAVELIKAPLHVMTWFTSKIPC